ncbi:MAG: peptidoglycan-binding protein [Chitinophagaceae bacterium]
MSDDSSFAFLQKGFSAFLYAEKEYSTNWCSEENWSASGDSLYQFIENAQLYVLFPEDYHADAIRLIRNNFIADSVGKTDRNDAAFWAKADIMMTDAFVQIVKDIKIGRLPNDSVSLRKDSVLSNEFYQQQFKSVFANGLIATNESLEPKPPEYALLKSGIKKFLDSSNYRKFTVIPYPEKNRQKFQAALQKRLYEGSYISFDSTATDSTQLSDAIKQFQKKKDIAVDGVAGEGTIQMLNVSDREKFIRIASSMDKYKLLPEKMPEKYISVNTSANYLQVLNGDKVD